MSPGAAPAALLWIVDGDVLDGVDVERVLRAGVRWIHLRDAAIPPQRWLDSLERWRQACPDLAVVVNGGPAWAREAGLGAHLKAAQPALDPVARRGWTPLGRSVHDPTEVQRAFADAPDYLVAGPFFETASKPGHPGIARAGWDPIRAASTGVPLLAIGGITPDRVATVAAAGAQGVAVRGGIHRADDPVAAAGAYVDALRAAGLAASAHQS